jgi:Helicase associated domain
LLVPQVLSTFFVQKWVNKQRMEKKFMDEGKRTSMTGTRVDCLESIGFVWAKRKGEASWMLKYTELQQYKLAHGNCDVATKYGPNPALGRWVSTQRSEYKILQRDGRSKHMTQSKIAMLNNLGFRWEMIPTKSSSPSSGSANSSSGED